MTCPICKKDVALDNPEMPFCSERCRLIDLGAWLTEQHAIAGDATPGEEGTTPAEPSAKDST